MAKSRIYHYKSFRQFLVSEHYYSYKEKPTDVDIFLKQERALWVKNLSVDEWKELGEEYGKLKLIESHTSKNMEKQIIQWLNERLGKYQGDFLDCEKDDDHPGLRIAEDRVRHVKLIIKLMEDLPAYKK